MSELIKPLMASAASRLMGSQHPMVGDHSQPAKEDLKLPYMERPLENVPDYFYRWLYLTGYSPLDIFIPGFELFYEIIWLWIPLFNLMLANWTGTLDEDGNTYKNGYFMLLEYIGISDTFPIF